jgi:hypothetical protein
MALSESALNEIRSELATLHQVRVRVDDRIRILESVLAPFDLREVGLPITIALPASGSTLSNITSAKEPHEPMPLPATTGKVGLRASAIAVLRERGPLRASEIAEILRERGFSEEGAKTPLSTRVYNDLWRMAERGHLKSEGGLFRLN